MVQTQVPILQYPTRNGSRYTGYLCNITLQKHLLPLLLCLPSFLLHKVWYFIPRSKAKALLIHRGPPCPLHPRGLYSVTGLGIRHALVARDIHFCTNVLYQPHQAADKFHHCKYELPRMLVTPLTYMKINFMCYQKLAVPCQQNHPFPHETCRFQEPTFSLSILHLGSNLHSYS